MKEELQRRIRLYRKERGPTVRQLAEEAGCTHSYISQIEKGATVPSLSIVGKLASALGIKVLDLFNDSPGDTAADFYFGKKERRSINYPDRKVATQLFLWLFNISISLSMELFDFCGPQEEAYVLIKTV